MLYKRKKGRALIALDPLSIYALLVDSRMRPARTRFGSSEPSYVPSRPVRAGKGGQRWPAHLHRLYCRSFRKEVIQPQVLLRLPCYDFTPIMGHTLGACLLAVSWATSSTAHFRDVTGGVYKARERIHGVVLIRHY